MHETLAPSIDNGNSDEASGDSDEWHDPPVPDRFCVHDDDSANWVIRRIAEARAYANERMQGSSARVAEVVELLVSELASNAVTHAATPFTISVQRDEEQTRVEVSDTGVVAVVPGRAEVVS